MATTRVASLATNVQLADWYISSKNWTSNKRIHPIPQYVSRTANAQSLNWPCKILIFLLIADPHSILYLYNRVTPSSLSKKIPSIITYWKDVTHFQHWMVSAFPSKTRYSPLTLSAIHFTVWKLANIFTLQSASVERKLVASSEDALTWSSSITPWRNTPNVGHYIRREK